MSRGKILLAILVALIVCLGAGFIWGNSGRSTLQTTLDDARLQLDLAEARGDILDGRVSLYSNNFGDASRHFESAKAPLQRLKQRYTDEDKREAASSIEAALTHVGEAQQLSAKLDPSANNKAGQALDAIKAAAATK
jgi:hypothetical protein